ncbi:MAG: helix-turn-helix transcriptional regulator [Dehalococcoidales bacterium]|nr:helix-turn-helix transcriptional regulator [Dehalococcoidales bacterium]
MKEFKEKVRELRIRRGWSQVDMAREMGVSPSTVQRWESKGSQPVRLARRQLRRLFRGAGVEESD